MKANANDDQLGECPQWATKGRSPSVNEGPLSGEEGPFDESEQTVLLYSKPSMAKARMQ